MDTFELESLRKRKLAIVLLLGGIGSLLIIAGLYFFINESLNLHDLFLIFWIGAIVLFFLAQNQCKNFENTVKESYINNIIANILDGRGKIEWSRQYNPNSIKNAAKEDSSVFDEWKKELAQLSHSPEEFLKAQKDLSERQTKELDQQIKDAVKNNSSELDKDLSDRQAREMEELYSQFSIDKKAADELAERYRPEMEKYTEQIIKISDTISQNFGLCLDPSKNPLIMAKLFKTGRLSVDDVFSGEYKGTPITITEATLTIGSGKSESTVFKGFFVSITSPKTFSGHTLIGKKRHFQTKGLEKLILPKTPFSKKYDIFTDNINEANQILTPELTNFLTNSKHPIGIACYADNIIATVHRNSDLFKLGSVFKKVDDQKQYIKFATEFNSALNLVDLLKEITPETREVFVS